MSQTTIDKVSTRLNKLNREVRVLRSLLISLAGEDKEGLYRPEFVKEILKAAVEKPRRAFKNAHSFLAELKRA